MFTAVVGFLGGWRQILIFVAVAAVATTVYFWIYSRGKDSRQPEIDRLKATIAEVNAAGKSQETRVEYVDREVIRLVEVGRKEDAERITELAGSLRLALDSLRNPGNRRANLKDADSAPAECRDHAAVPGQLSVSDAEFLVREAARADRIAVQRDGAIRDYNAVRNQVNGLNGAGKTD